MTKEEMRRAVKPFQLQKQECRVCSKPRWNDGLKCPQCGSYQDPKAGNLPDYDAYRERRMS